LAAKSSFSQIKLGVKLSTLKGGASGKCRYDYSAGFPPRLEGGASSRLARELENTHATLGENSNKQILPQTLLVHEPFVLLGFGTGTPRSCHSENRTAPFSFFSIGN